MRKTEKEQRMGEIDEQKAKKKKQEAEALTSAAAAAAQAVKNPNSNFDATVNTNTSSKSREEGELYSSDFDYDDLTEDIAAKKETTPVTFGNDCNRAAALGTTSKNITNNGKSYEKNKGPFVPFVISFSDDEIETGSDLDCRDGNIGEARCKMVGGNRSGRLNSVTRARLQTSQHNQRNKSDTIPSRQFSRTFVPSKAPSNRFIPRKGEPFSIEQKSRVNAPKEGGEDYGHNKHAISSRKVQDLRQLIAIRERELKHKYTQQKDEKTLGSRRDHDSTKFNNDTLLVQEASSNDNVQGEPKEPDRKRLKVCATLSDQLTSNVQQDIPAIQSMVALEKFSTGSYCDQQRVDDCDNREGVSNDCDSSEKELPCKPHLRNSTKQKQVDNQRAVTSTDLPRGVHINGKINKSDGNTKLVDRFITSKYNFSKSDAEAVSEQSASLKTSPLWNYLERVNISEYDSMDLQSLLEFEELQDKEMEEAQEHRRKCELAERNARKAYRNAQRVLIEANAICTQLYSKRELFSSHLQSRMMEDSCFLWFSRPPDYAGARTYPSNNMHGADMQMLSPANHQQKAGLNQNENEIQKGIHFVQNLAAQQADCRNLVSGPSNEQDGSVPEPDKDKDLANGISSPSNDLHVSANEDDEGFLCGEVFAQSNQNYHKKKKLCEENGKITVDDLERNRVQEKENCVNDVAGGNSHSNTPQDSLLLEASLRSQLFARRGIKASSKKRVQTQGVETVNDDSIGTLGSSGAQNFVAGAHKCSSLGGNEKMKINSSQLPIEIGYQCHAEKPDFNSGSLSSSKPFEFSIYAYQSKRPINILCSVLRSTFRHIKVLRPTDVDRSQARNQDSYASNVYDVSSSGGCCNKLKPTLSRSGTFKESSIDFHVGQDGFYTCNLAIDPSWPLCMFELRGKCNNEDCSWQHYRDYTFKDLSDVNTYDQDQLKLETRKTFSATNHSKCSASLALAPPTYLVCLDNLKVDLHFYNSLLVHGIAQHFQICFSTSLVISNLLPRDLLMHGSFLHGTHTRIEVFGGWNRQSSCFHRKKCIMSERDQEFADNNSILETALLILTREANKHKGRSEAVKVLAQALEVDPMSEVIWIVYLLIYHSNPKPLGNDDLFRCAVEYNRGSYELWLMYINSRMQLYDRLTAYERAIFALCHHVSTCEDTIYASECILDLFLQMIHCFYVSGKIDAALRKICELFSIDVTSDMLHSNLLSNILGCLTIPDKCTFWICCVYLVVYKKLPDTIVQQFECHKELSLVEWPFANLTVDEKQQGIRLMGKAVDSLPFYVDGESLECERNLKAAHIFALKHISCIAVLEGLECSRVLIDKYVKLYPSCLELKLTSARVQEHDLENLNSTRFEVALCNWPDDVPGIQCIWNQYAEYALQKGRFDFFKELMDRWFHTVRIAKYCQSRKSDEMNAETSLGSLESVLELDTVGLNSTCRMDFMFGLINLSLYKMLRNDDIGSRLAIEKALKVASIVDYTHCVREHAMFFLNGLQLVDGVSYDAILNILGSYLEDSRSPTVSEPLSRKFIQRIRNPRVQQLVSSLLIPVSSNFSLVNLILELCYGPSLLPQTPKSSKDLVDFVEAIMAARPSNYELSLSVCEQLSSGFNFEDVSSSFSFWASLLMVNALFQAVPVAPEYVWAKAAVILNNLTDIKPFCMTFHDRALMLYPFSLKLWTSYLNLAKSTGNLDSIVERARQRGIEL